MPSGNWQPSCLGLGVSNSVTMVVDSQSSECATQDWLQLCGDVPGHNDTKSSANKQSLINSQRYSCAKFSLWNKNIGGNLTSNFMTEIEAH